MAFQYGKRCLKSKEKASNEVLFDSLLKRERKTSVFSLLLKRKREKKRRKSKEGKENYILPQSLLLSIRKIQITRSVHFTKCHTLLLLLNCPRHHTLNNPSFPNFLFYIKIWHVSLACKGLTLIWPFLLFCSLLCSPISPCSLGCTLWNGQ